MEVSQCVSVTKSGKRCKLNAKRYAPRCWIHKMTHVKKSDIENAGNGLFAHCDLKKGTRIGSYIINTDRMSFEEFKDRYKNRTPTHVWAKNRDEYYDATDASKNVIGMANRGNKIFKNNTKITKNGNLITIKNIKSGEELLTPYGSNYRIYK